MADTGLSVGDQFQRIDADGVLGYVESGRGLSAASGTSLATGDDVSHGTDQTMKRRNDEAFILILASL